MRGAVLSFTSTRGAPSVVVPEHAAKVVSDATETNGTKNRVEGISSPREWAPSLPIETNSGSEHFEPHTKRNTVPSIVSVFIVVGATVIGNAGP
jgi:hypothetical protein